MRWQIFCTVFLALILAACTTPTSTATLPPTGEGFQPTATPAASSIALIATATQDRSQPTAAPTAGSTPVRAADEIQWVTAAARAPRLYYALFYSAAAQSEVSYHIYLPEVYDSQPERRFPVLYWLHGSGGGLSGIPQLVKYFNSAIADGKMTPALIVFANGLENSMWVNSQEGRVPMETVVIQELIPHIDAAYRTIATRQGRLVEGFSMGGYGAARLGFKYPELFRAVSMLGAGPLQQVFDPATAPRSKPGVAQHVLDSVYGGSQEYFLAQSPWFWAEQNAATLQSQTLIRQVIGDRDETLENNRIFDAHLTELGIPHSFILLPGVAHNPMGVLEAMGEDTWAFYRLVFAAE